MAPEYDVFLSYSRQDKPAVKQIGEALKTFGLAVWLDEWELQPGRPWQEEVEKALERSRATVVFIGPQGMGPWEEPEMRAALEEQVHRKIPVIPVLLPGVSDTIKLPLFLRRNTWVIFCNDLQDQGALYRLYWGITGKKPDREKKERQKHSASIPSGEQEPLEEAVNNLVAFLRSGNITFFLGREASEGGDNLPPSSYEITYNLLSSLKLIHPDYNQLLPPVDMAAAYYAIKEGDSNLEDKIVDLIMERSNAIPSLHLRLAALLKILQRLPKRRVRRRTQQLIITTNFDVMMERALLRFGIAFTRIVQHKSSPRIDINEYRDVVLLADDVLQFSLAGASPQRVNPDDYEELDEIIMNHGHRAIGYGSDNDSGESLNPLHSLPLKDLTEPILYKFHGSQDIPNSCTITTDQYFDFFWKLLKKETIPAQISEIISNSPILFLGSDLLTQDFRLTYHTLLRKPFEIRTNRRYALQVSPDREERNYYRQMEAKIWVNIKNLAIRQFGIEVVEEMGDIFLEKLCRRVEVDLLGKL